MLRNSRNVNLFETLNVGEMVAIVHYLNGTIGFEGRYKVVDKNKVRITLKRIDGLERVFSVQTGNEKDYTGKYSRSNSFVETIADYEKRQQNQERKNHYRTLWENLELAVKNKKMDEIKQLISKIEELGNV